MNGDLGPAMPGIVAAALTAFAVSAALPILARPLLERMGVIDLPSERSSHSRPTVRGLGLTIAAGLAAGWAVAFGLGAPSDGVALAAWALAGAVAAAAVGWAEDFRGLSILRRAALQLAVGAGGTLALLIVTGKGLWWLPFGAVAVAAYVNVANFMDGINGISGLHAVAVGALYAAAGALTGHVWLVVAGVLLAASFAGFLPWNMLRGSMFMGDVGSYLLGAGIAFLALAAFFADIRLEYVFSPVLVYLADTFTTLVRRALAGKRWYASHREHTYQRLTDAGLGHTAVALIVTAATVLVGLAGFFAATAPAAGAVAAQAITAVVLLAYLAAPRLLRERERRRAAEG
ncbi:UDP-phosphate glycosyltransferase [Sinomonas halotolerans]|uniref:UDP-phosphate glycosyltransferase n=1 Tax=Sinomonas halotolerans TaxID=1644133 RepID=A0ABU9WYD0_9MICC